MHYNDEIMDFIRNGVTSDERRILRRPRRLGRPVAMPPPETPVETVSLKEAAALLHVTPLELKLWKAAGKYALPWMPNTRRPCLHKTEFEKWLERSKMKP